MVISTSGNLAAILDFDHTSAYHEIGSTITRKFDSENIGKKPLEFCRYVLQNSRNAWEPFHPSLFPAAGKRRKKPLPGEGLM